MTTTPPQLHLHIGLVDASGLAGDGREYAPKLAKWGSWGQHRHAQVTGLAEVGNMARLCTYTLPALDKPIRGDETVALKLLASSKFSQIGAIDAIESGHVERVIQVARSSVPLVSLLTAALAGKALDLRQSDPRLEVQLSHKVKDPAEVARLTYKGVLRVMPQLEGPGARDYAQRLLTTLESKLNAPNGPLLYGTERFIEAMIEARELFQGAYVDTMLDTDKGALPMGPERSLDGLQLAAYLSEEAILPPVALLLQDAHTRPLPSHSDLPQYQKTYAPTLESARLMQRFVEAASLRLGFESGQAFATAILDQHTRSYTDATISARYLQALEVIQDAATFAANAIEYTKDMRYANAGETPPATTDGTDGTEANFEHRLHRRLTHTRPLDQRITHLLGRGFGGSRLSGATTPTTPMAANKSEEGMVELESFDAGALYGIVNADDCEGSSVTGSTVLRNIPKLAEAAPAGTLPILEAAVRVCRNRFVFDAAASVTGAYVNTEGREMSPEELKNLKDLPTIGDAVDARSQIGGHCHGLWMSRYATGTMLARGGYPVNKDLPGLASDMAHASAWQKREPTLVLEGTSSIESWVLPAGEVGAAVLGTSADAKQFEARAAQRRALAKSLRDKAPTLAKHFKIEGLSYYTSKQEPTRRISSFYRGVAHLMSAELYQMHPLYGQLAVFDPVAKTHGMEIGRFLRAPLEDRKDVALRAPFYSVGLDAWRTKVEPVMACALNQMPLNRFARFDTPQESSLAMARTLHVMSDLVISSLAKVPEPLLGQALDRHAHGLAMHMDSAKPATTTLQKGRPWNGALQARGLGAGVSGSADTAASASYATTLCLYSKPWRLADTPETSAGMQHELDELKAAGLIQGHQFVCDHPLAQGQDVVTLILTLPHPE